jgi:hypothetical protein
VVVPRDIIEDVDGCIVLFPVEALGQIEVIAKATGDHNFCSSSPFSRRGSCVAAAATQAVRLSVQQVLHFMLQSEPFFTFGESRERCDRRCKEMFISCRGIGPASRQFAAIRAGGNLAAKLAVSSAGVGGALAELMAEMASSRPAF